MNIKSFEEITIYESPDGGRTVYSRKSGETVRHLHHVDEDYLKEQELYNRWVALKEAVMMNDPTINDALEKVEMLLVLKRNSR